MPDLQASAARDADLFSSQRGDARGAAYLHIARRAVERLHEWSVWGVHVAEFRAGVVGLFSLWLTPIYFFMNTYSFAAARYKLRDALE